MPSQAKIQFEEKIRSGARIRKLTLDARLRPIPVFQRSEFLHAALASHVAAWDFYVNSVIAEAVVEINKPLDQEYQFLHGLMKQLVLLRMKKFNTPNSENSREAFILCVGYDPISDWQWPRGGMNGPESRAFLNEILKVRHSFAHGFNMPSYNWNTTPSGKRQLNSYNVKRIENFLLALANRTDYGLRQHLISSISSCNFGN